MPTTTSAHGGASSVEDSRRGRTHRSVLPLLGIIAFLFTFVGLSGVGDAPAPHDQAASMAAHFQAVDDEVMAAAPFGILGAAALAAFVLALGRCLRHAGQPAAGSAVAVGGLLAAAYLLAIHVVYVSLGYEVATTSAEATKALFVTTILAVPVFGLATAVVLGGAVYGGMRAQVLPGWWVAISTAGAVLAATAVFSYAYSGFFSPDVQQQTVGAALQVWVLLTAIGLARRDRRPRATHERARP